MEPNLSVEIAGIHLEHPLMNGAGTCKSLEGAEGVKELARSHTAAVMVGTTTVKKREGNSGEVYFTNELFSLNSLGWPNAGRAYYEHYFPDMAYICHANGKPFFVSVGGFSPHEYAVLAKLAFDRGADLVELDVSCQSVAREDWQNRIPCFNEKLLGKILLHVQKATGVDAKVAVKLAPFSDSVALGRIAKVIGSSKLVKAVTSTNTFPNALDYDEKGNPCITPNEGFAGLGGPALKPIGLGQVKQLRELLPSRIDIIGSGGIASGKDVFDYKRAGATAVQIGTGVLNRRFKIFTQILNELV